MRRQAIFGLLSLPFHAFLPLVVHLSRIDLSVILSDPQHDLPYDMAFLDPSVRGDNVVEGEHLGP